MKTQRISTILMSAYLSAMLASSMAPVYNGITLAGTVNPSAAQAAFSNAVNGLDATWIVATAGVSPAPASPEPKFASVPPKSEPVMSEEMLARLLKLADEQQKPGSIPANVCLLFKMCDGSAKMLVRMVQTDNPKGDYITKPWEGTSEDIVVVRKNADGTLHYFLTDKTRKLRAAILAENGTSRLVLNETLAPSFEATMAHLAKEAADLPPTGTSVAAAGS